MKSPFTFGSIFVLGAALAVSGMADTAQTRLRSFPIPTPESQPISIIQGPDGNLWFVEQNASNVARITPNGEITEFRTPTFSFPLDITAGPDGNVWFSEGAVGQIAFITPGGHIEEILFDSLGAAGGIVTGPDGNIWFTDLIGNSVWRLDLATRVPTSFPVPTPDSFPSDITVGSDGNLWFVEGIGKIGRSTPEGVITEFGSGLGLPFSIATGPDGNVWFTERFVPEIGKITPNGDFTFYPIPASAEEIAPGPGNTLIYTEFGPSKIAQITTDGVVTESPEIPDALPIGITLGPNHTIWFLGYGNNKVYRAKFSR
jgi:streptogramin lyase